MTIIQIRYFLETVESGSLKKASEKLYISHQALSKQIRTIENELETELFDRNDRKNLSLTEAGKTMYAAWKDVMAKHDNALDQIRQLKIKKKTSIVVGVQDIQKIQFESMQAFAKYKDANPDLDFEYKIGTPKEIRIMMANDEIDIAIIFSPSVERNNKYSFLLVNEHPENPVIAVSVDNPLSANQNLSLKDIENETVIVIDPSYSKDIETKMRRDFVLNDFNPKNLKAVRDPHEVKMALVMNKGVTITYMEQLSDISDKVKAFPFKTAKSNINVGTMIIWKDKNLDETARKIGSYF